MWGRGGGQIRYPLSTIAPLHCTFPGQLPWPMGCYKLGTMPKCNVPQGLGHGALRLAVCSPKKNKIDPSFFSQTMTTGQWLNLRREENAIAQLVDSTRVHPSTAAAGFRAQLANSSRAEVGSQMWKSKPWISCANLKQLKTHPNYIQMFSWVSCSAIEAKVSW